MNLTPYVFQYAKVPADVAVNLSLGYRRRLSDGSVIINQTEAQPLDGNDFVEKITGAGGVVISNADAKELLKSSRKAPVELEDSTELVDGLDNNDPDQEPAANDSDIPQEQSEDSPGTSQEPAGENTEENV